MLHRDDPTVNTFATRLKSARQAKKWTQEELATASGVPQTTIASAESGDTKTMRRVIPLARVLGVHPEWLQHGTGPREVNLALRSDLLKLCYQMAQLSREQLAVVRAMVTAFLLPERRQATPTADIHNEIDRRSGEDRRRSDD